MKTFNKVEMEWSKDSYVAVRLLSLREGGIGAYRAWKLTLEGAGPAALQIPPYTGRGETGS